MSERLEKTSVVAYLEGISQGIPKGVVTKIREVAERFLELGGEIYEYTREDNNVVVFWFGDIHCRVTKYGSNSNVDTSFAVEIVTNHPKDDKFIYYFKNGEFHSGEVSLQEGRLNQTVPFDLDQVFGFLMGR